MPRIRRKLPRIFASLLVALSITCLAAPLVRAARAAGQDSPAPAQKSALDAPARELARRINASLPGGTHVEIEVRNQSSLSEDDAAAIRAALAGELSARGLRTHGEGPGAASVIITLSENVQGYVWVAQIQHGDDSAVLLQSVPRETPAATPPESERVLLHKQLLWSGTPHVIDAVEAPASGNAQQRLFLLELDGTTAAVTEPATEFLIDLPIPVPHLRDPDGDIYVIVDKGQQEIDAELIYQQTFSTFPFATHEYRVSQRCFVYLSSQTAPDCSPRQESILIADYVIGSSGPPPLWREARVPLSAPCERRLAALDSGEGDDTQPDILVAYDDKTQDEPMSAPVLFPGPVIRLEGHGDDAAPIAIVHNLQTGNYEVYRITASCSQ